MRVFTFVFLVYAVLPTSAKLLNTSNLMEHGTINYENARMSFIFFATDSFRIKVVLNEVPHLLCRKSRTSEVVLHREDDGIAQCPFGVTPFEYHELKLDLLPDSSFRIEDPSGASVGPVFQSPVEVVIGVGGDYNIPELLAAGGAVYVTRKIEGCPAQSEEPAVSLTMIGVVAVLSLLLVLATLVSCILYLLVPPETIKRVLFRSGGKEPGCAAISSESGQKDAQDTPLPPPRPTDAQTPSETRTPLAKIPSVPLAPPNAAATPHQDDARQSNHDDGYDHLLDPNYDYIEANVVRPVDRAILDKELAGANPKWKQPVGGFRKKSDPQATGFRKLSNPQAPKPAAATPGHYQPSEDDEYINIGSGFPQQHNRGYNPRGYPAHY